MTSPISSLSMIANAYGTGAPTKAAKGVQGDFGSMASDAARASIDTLRKAERTTAKGIAGKADIQDVVQAISSAETTVQTVVSLRDKLVSAYADILRMPI